METLVIGAISLGALCAAWVLWQRFAARAGCSAHGCDDGHCAAHGPPPDPAPPGESA